MIMRTLSIQCVAIFFLSVAMKSVIAAHPFVTDDTSTQGRDNHQIELNTDWVRMHGANSRIASFIYSYGQRENVDLLVGVPAGVAAPAGLGNVTVGLKWRILESDHTSVAVRPEFILPTGDEDKELGSGHGGMALALIATHESGPWTFHGNAGLDVNRYRRKVAVAAHRNMRWRVSAAAAYQTAPRLAIVGDIGIARNSDPASRVNPVYFLTGLIYSPRKDLDLDAGVKFGLNHAEADRQIGIGLTSRF
jgi:hypothetical protein